MNEETFLHLAALSRMDVTKEERDSLMKDMESIVDFVNIVQERSVQSHTQDTGGRINIFRNDEVQPILPNHDLAEAAPLNRDGFIEVPKVIE